MSDFPSLDDLSSDLLENLANLNFQASNECLNEINNLIETSEKHLEELLSPRSAERKRGNSCSPAVLIRTDSITGRPEEFYKTIKKKNAKGTALQIGDYQLGERLGKGAFGVVYKGLDTKTGQFIAVKRINRSKVDSESIVKEISFLQTFNHVNIVSYKGLVRTENHLNLVLEYVDSGSLAQVLAGYGFFPESLAAIYTSQVLDGLSYLHSKGVVHRDIKGGNILITREGTVKLADFGIATSVSNSNADHHSLVEGSPYWMAPEIIEMSTTTTASDIWSLGCTLIELLTGVPPYFEMAPVSACYRMAKDDHPPFPDDITPNLHQFLESCFQKDPTLRPTADQLRNYPWILEHAKPSQHAISVDDMRNTIKRYTIGRESGKINISSVDWENNNFNFEKLSVTAPAKELQVSSIKEKKKKEKKPFALKEMTSDTSLDYSKMAQNSDASLESNSSEEVISDGTSTVRKRKRGVTTLFRKKKDKNKRKTVDLTKNTDAALIMINIYGFETKRSVFAYTAYQMKIRIGINQWEIERTWSEFKDFHDKLKKDYPTLNLPECPQRKFWGVMDPDFIRQRWQDLQIYCNSLLKIAEVRESDLFSEFLKP